MNTDLISREAVLSIIEESQEDDADEWMGYPWKVTPNLLMNEVRKLPSVTPMQKTRYWISHENDGNKSRIGEIGDCIAMATDEPSVTPMQRTGHWIEIAQYSDGIHKIECSECESHIFDRGHANSFNVKNKYKYCPKCGCRMVEPQESDHKCHTCKHYTSGENDGSCGSYICKGYSNWESEEQNG